MPDYLLDCNHLSAGLTKSSPLRLRIEKERQMGRRFVTCYPVLCELEVGIIQSARHAENRFQLGRLLRHVRVWPLDTTTTHIFAATHVQLRERGRSLSQVDKMIAALARQHGLTVLTTDRDFEALPDLRVENWVG